MYWLALENCQYLPTGTRVYRRCHVRQACLVRLVRQGRGLMPCLVSLTEKGNENRSHLRGSKTPDPEAWCCWCSADGDGRHSIQWDAQPMGSACRQIYRTAVTPVCDWDCQGPPLVLNPQACAARQPRVSRAHSPVLVNLPTSRLAAVVPAVVYGRGYLPGVCLEPDYQPKKGKPLHAAPLALGPLREGLVMPASDRTFRGDPLPGFVRVTGAGEVSRGKTPVACGKSSDGKSAPPLRA